METVLGLATGVGATIKNEALAQTAEAAPVREASEPTVVSAPSVESATPVSSDGDDTLSYFAQMAAED